MLLILPVFLAMIFTIMEIGYVSFRLIVLNHATYEVARIGGMTWFSPSGGAAQMSSMMKRILPQATVECVPDKTMHDPQADQDNFDLVCTGQESVQLVFPISSIILAKPSGSGHRALAATVRMPIEQPLKK
jgi:hypothetical protein